MYSCQTCSATFRCAVVMSTTNEFELPIVTKSQNGKRNETGNMNNIFLRITIKHYLCTNHAHVS